MRAISTAILVLSVACTPNRTLLGVWELRSIDGLPPPAAEPRRLDSDGPLAGLVWTEIATDRIRFEVERGRFRQNATERLAFVASPEGYRRMTGEPPPGTGRIRREQPNQQDETFGTWEQVGDSIFFYRSEEQLKEELRGPIRMVRPDASASEIEAALDSIAAEAAARPLYRGELTDSGLTVLDTQDRLLLFEQVQP